LDDVVQDSRRAVPATATAHSSWPATVTTGAWHDNGNRCVWGSGTVIRTTQLCNESWKSWEENRVSHCGWLGQRWRSSRRPWALSASRLDMRHAICDRSV